MGQLAEMTCACFHPKASHSASVELMISVLLYRHRCQSYPMCLPWWKALQTDWSPCQSARLLGV